MARVASLGMYDGPEAATANDTLWALIAERLSDAGVTELPARLDRARPLPAIWDDRELLLAQCCGYPLATRYRDRLRYVATPCYTAPGCRGPIHRSRIVVRADDLANGLHDLRGRRAAINERDSNTGMNLLRAAIAPLAAGRTFFETVVETGSHRASLEAVASGEADVAAIDPVSFSHTARERPALAAALRTIGWTRASPGLPLVTAADTSDAMVEQLRATLHAVTGDAAARPTLAALMMARIEVLPPGAYDRLAAIEARATELGYPVLA